MADRDLVYQPDDAAGGLEAGIRPYDPPLLPYEVALIEALGCTEQEYRQFVRHAQLQARVRPAEYAHIPDVVNDPVSIVVSLVIGVALSAVSTLLAPKAPSLGDQPKQRGKKLADQIGPTRFNQTTSFDNVSSLAEYSQPIPIPFGKRGTGADDKLTGGLILAPALVWSRMHSFGSFQLFEGIYVAGEYGVDTPDLGGVLLGTTPLGSLGQRQFALYWSSNAGNNRPSAGKLIQGTQGAGATGTLGLQSFTAPTANGQFDQGFSMAYNPSSNRQFGTSNPIQNGTAHRFNWEIVSAPYDFTIGPDNKDSREEIIAKRRKIAGTLADVLHVNNSERGMPGVGRAYSRRMGLVKHNTNEPEDRTFVDVSAGDTVTFEINTQNWKDLQQDADDGFKGTSITLKDLKSAADGWRTRAADLLTLGSQWIIGACAFVVESRNLETYDGTQNLQVVLRCTAVLGPNEIGLSGTRTVRDKKGLAGYEGDTFNPNKHCGAAFYNICQLHMANVRPVRRETEVIEIGIRSQVWNRANGLCNFNRIPDPKVLFQKYDKKNITLETPRMDKYFKRTSCFSIWVRPVQEYGKAAVPWKRLNGPVLCVQGDAPVDQYNSVRIRPKQTGYFEYRFIPRTGSDMAIFGVAGNVVIILDSNSSKGIGEDYECDYGTFRLTVKGRYSTVSAIRPCEEMYTDAETTSSTTVTSSKPTTIAAASIETWPTNSTQLVWQAWFWYLFGSPVGKNDGDTASFTKKFNKADGSEITISILATCGVGNDYVGNTISPKYVELTGTTAHWINYSLVYNIDSYTGNWAVDDFVQVGGAVDSVFKDEYGYSYVIVQLAVTAVEDETTEIIDITAERKFENFTQVSDCSHYIELTKSNESAPEHEIVYINEYASNETVAEYENLSTLALSVRSNGQLGSMGQIRVWVPTGIDVYRLIEKDIKPSNLFADLVYYLLTNKQQGVGNTVPIELVDVDSLEITARFLRQNKIFFDSVVEDSENLRSFLYDNAALQLCNFTIKNGRFGMMPALPYDSNYGISTDPIAIEQIFTSGNIIADSLQVQYIDAAQRADFRALMSWRVTVENDLPDQASALVDWADVSSSNLPATQQSFDLTDFCTNREQALRTARFLLSTRRRVTHTVSFKTVPDALGIQPGSYIRVITASTSYSAASNGVITDAGTLVSVSSIDNGTYDALVYKPSTGDVLEQKITISNGAVSSSALYGSLFTLLSETVSKGVYQVEQLTLDEDGLINVSAVHVPVDANGASIVAKDVLTPSNFKVLE